VYNWRGPTAFLIAKEARRKKKQMKRSKRTNGAFLSGKGTRNKETQLCIANGVINFLSKAKQ
jgi:hypothetical protein